MTRTEMYAGVTRTRKLIRFLHHDDPHTRAVWTRALLYQIDYYQRMSGRRMNENDHGFGFCEECGAALTRRGYSPCECAALAAAPYRWVITHDHLDNKPVNIVGPRNADDSITDNPVPFEMFDDDREKYFSGTLFGEYDGFEPLDDYGTPGYGCTSIKINGEWL